MKFKSRFMWLVLASSCSTLLCCALPLLLVMLGAGASVAAMFGGCPALPWLSSHKLAVFGLAAVLLLAGGLLLRRPSACSSDPEQALACVRYQRQARCLFAGAFVLFAIGAFFAFVAPLLFR